MDTSLIVPIVSFKGDKPLYLTFGLKAYSLTICCGCGKASQVCGSIKAAGDYLYNHWKNSNHGSGDNLSKSDYKSWLKSALDATSEQDDCYLSASPAKRYPPISLSLLSSYPDLMLFYSLEKAEICSKCLSPITVEGKKQCCYPRTILETKVATLNGVRQFTVLDEDQLKMVVNSSAVSAPQVTSGTSSIKNSLNLLPDGKMTPSTVDASTTDQKKGIAIGIRADSDLTGKEMFESLRNASLCGASDMFKSRNEIIDQPRRSQQSNSRLTQAERSLLDIMGMMEPPSQQELDDFAASSRPLNMSNPDDRIFKRAARILLSVNDDGTSEHPAMVAWVSKAPMIEYGFQKMGDEAGVDLRGHFRPSESEFEVRVNHGGRFLRMMCEIEPNFSKMFEALKFDFDESIVESDPTAVEARVYNISVCVAEMFHSFSMMLLRSGTCNLLQTLRPFIAEIPVHRRGGSIDENDSNESSDSDGDEEDAHPGQASTQNRAIISRPQRLRKILNSILWLLKSCLLSESHTALLVARQENEAFITRDFIDSRLRGGNIASIAIAVGKLGLIEKGTRNPGRNDVLWSENARDGPAMLLDGGIRITSKELSDCGRRVIEGLTESLSAVLFNGSPKSKDDQEFWEKLKIGLFSDDKDYFKMKMDKENFVRLSTSPSQARFECEQILSKRSTDTRDYRIQLTTLQKYIFASVLLFGGAVARPREVERLIREKEKRGTLFLDEDFQQIQTLLFCDLISKTKKGGKSILPPWLSRVILLYLDLFAPASIDGIRKELNDAIGPEEDDNVCLETAWKKFENRLVDEWKNRLSMHMGALPFLSPAFKKSLEKFKVETVKVATKECLGSIGSSILDCSTNRLDQYLHDVICVVGFEMPQLRLGQVRKILVNVKKQPQRFLPDPGKIMDTVEANHVALILRSIAENAAETTMLAGLSSIAHNTGQTTLQSYMSRPARGMSDESMIEKRASRLTAEAGQIILGAPVIISTRPGSSKKLHLNQLPTSMWHGLRTDMIANGDVEKGDQRRDPLFLLTQKLKEVTTNENAKWLSEEQRDAALIRFTTDSDMVLATSCGGGKTLSMVLPALLAVQGFTVFLLPTRALVQDMMVTLRGLNIECFDDEVFAEMDLHDPRFQPDAFQTLRWNEGTLTRIVLATYDTGCSERILPWYCEARRRGLLNGFFIDEVHQLFLSATFRPIMFKMPMISDVGVPVAVASGTLPGAMEDAVIERMRLGKRGLKRKKTPTIYLKRRVVDLWRVEGCEDLAEWTLQTVKRFHERRHTVDKRPFMVFCMTMEGANAVAGRLRSLTDFSVAQIDSKVEDSQIRALLTKVRKGEEPHILVGTSAAAEGIDLPAVGLVIVLQGTYGGLLTLHQMFARSGRGPPSVGALETPRCILVYCPDKFPGNSSAYSNDQALLKSFPNGYDGKVEKFVGFESIENLFKAKEGKTRCGGRLMEDLFDGGAENPKSCTLCLDCNPQLTKGLYPAPKGRSVWSNGKALMELMKKRAAQSGSPSRAPASAPSAAARSPSVLEETLKEEKECLRRARWFLQNVNHKCPLCGLDMHYPNQCRVMQATCALTNTCNVCLRKGHYYKDHVKPVLKRRDAESEIRNFGCLVWVNSGFGNRADPCDECWLIHGEDSPIECKGFNNPCRPILLKVYYDEKLRQEFFNSTRLIPYPICRNRTV